MIPNRDFLAGLVAVAFFALVTFVLIPAYVKVPSFIPGFAPPPDMWPRIVAILGLFMGFLTILFALPAYLKRRSVREISEDPVKHPSLYVKYQIVRFIAVLAIFALFVEIMPIFGFLVSTIILLAALFLMIGTYQYKFSMVLLVIIFPVLLYLTFSEITHTPFPHGTLFSEISPDFHHVTNPKV